MKQKITFLILSILLIGLCIFKYDKVIEEQKENETETILSLTIDGEKAENFPSKESGKTIEIIFEDKSTEESKGNATGEIGPFSNSTYGTQSRQISSWYQNESWFVSEGPPWFMRGGNTFLGSGAGLFTFNRDNGGVRDWLSYRIILGI